nr:hypothetical protein [Kofleriaceae bacterium]
MKLARIVIVTLTLLVPALAVAGDRGSSCSCCPCPGCPLCPHGG